MGIDWFRQYHGTPCDPKWQLVARRSGQHRAFVVAVWSMLEDHASQAEPRGSIAALDLDVVAAALDMEREQVAAIVDGMKGLVHDGERLTAWDKRQPQREDPSTERTRRFRERKKRETKRTGTQRNAAERAETKGDAGERTETQGNGRLEKTRKEKIREDSTTPSDSGDSAARAGEVLKVLQALGVDHHPDAIALQQHVTYLAYQGFDAMLDIVPGFRAGLAQLGGVPRPLSKITPFIEEIRQARLKLDQGLGGRHGHQIVQTEHAGDSDRVAKVVARLAGRFGSPVEGSS